MRDKMRAGATNFYPRDKQSWAHSCRYLLQRSRRGSLTGVFSICSGLSLNNRVTVRGARERERAKESARAHTHGGMRRHATNWCGWFVDWTLMNIKFTGTLDAMLNGASRIIRLGSLQRDDSRRENCARYAHKSSNAQNSERPVTFGMRARAACMCVFIYVCVC